MKEFLIIYRYSSVAILVASEMFRQSMSQNLADTVVVNETQSLTKVKGVDPVTSSHWALVGPPLLGDYPDFVKDKARIALVFARESGRYGYFRVSQNND